jgi:hypothetical protein
MNAVPWTRWLVPSEEPVSATVIVNPASDRVFGETVRRLAAATSDPSVLQGQLRHVYPEAVVRRRELSGERFVVWYVYRDGYWVSGDR